MELSFEKTTHIGLGYATSADAFQCGREAAQMAKGQVPTGANDLILALAPNNVHFKDFIEGVRLVTGEDRLVGIPVSWVITHDLPSLDACVVMVVRFSSIEISIVSSGENALPLDSDITSLMTQCRQKRGNARKLFDYHGLLIFENLRTKEVPDMAHRLAFDAGLESWVIGLTPDGAEENPLICRSEMIRQGMIGLEFLSNNPCGIGTVAIGSFLGKPDIYKEAVKSSMRDALSQLQGQKPTFGLLLYDFPSINFSRDELWDIFRSAGQLAHDLPLIGLPTHQQFSRSLGRALVAQKGSVITFLVPH